MGVPTKKLRKIAKKCGDDEQLIQDLGNSEYNECKIIAVLLMNSNDYSKEQIEKYMDLVHSWDLCDMYCKHVIIKKKIMRILY
ncbi:DNA alkylation repair protein [Vagococcus vulneris]